MVEVRFLVPERLYPNFFQNQKLCLNLVQIEDLCFQKKSTLRQYHRLKTVFFFQIMIFFHSFLLSCYRTYTKEEPNDNFVSHMRPLAPLGH